MRRPITVLLYCLVTLIGHSAGATNYHVYKKFEAAPRSAPTAHRSENRSARGGPLHLFHSSAGKIEQGTAQSTQRKKNKIRQDNHF
jgi:hypothetical protein